MPMTLPGLGDGANNCSESTIEHCLITTPEIAPARVRERRLVGAGGRSESRSRPGRHVRVAEPTGSVRSAFATVHRDPLAFVGLRGRGGDSTRRRRARSHMAAPSTGDGQPSSNGATGRGRRTTRRQHTAYPVHSRTRGRIWVFRCGVVGRQAPV
jgi:hypothetical protein